MGRTLEVYKEDSVIAHLRRMVGGNLMASEISGEPVDPNVEADSTDEDLALASRRICGTTDNIDVLGVLVYGMEPTSYAILTGKIRKPDLFPAPEKPKGLRRIGGYFQHILASNRFLPLYSAGSAI